MWHATKLLILSVTSLVGLALSAQPAFATAPRITPINDSFSFTSDFCTFPVQVAESAQGFETQYFDAAGNPTSDVVLLTLTGTWTNPESGEYLVERSRVRNVFPQDGGVYVIGLNYHIRLPSGRTVLIDAGKLFFDDGELVFEAGEHQAQDGDVAAFCAALS
jgi:hypothetical protein